MQGKLIHLRLPEKLYSEVQAAVKDFGFHSASDFLRNATRQVLNEYETQKAIKAMAKYKGVLKGKVRRLTPKERDALWKEFLEEKAKGKNVFKELGLA